MTDDVNLPAGTVRTGVPTVLLFVLLIKTCTAVTFVVTNRKVLHISSVAFLLILLSKDPLISAYLAR